MKQENEIGRDWGLCFRNVAYKSLSEKMTDVERPNGERKPLFISGLSSSKGAVMKGEYK